MQSPSGCSCGVGKTARDTDNSAVCVMACSGVSEASEQAINAFHWWYMHEPGRRDQKGEQTLNRLREMPDPWTPDQVWVLAPKTQPVGGRKP